MKLTGLNIDCPYCHRALRLTTNGDDAAPVPGDHSMCWYCGVVSVFTHDPLGQLTLRKATPGENVVIANDRNVAIARFTQRRTPNPFAAVEMARRIRDRDDDSH